VIPLQDDTPVERLPVVTYALVAANVLAFLWQVDVGHLAHVYREAHAFSGDVPAALATVGQYAQDHVASTARRGGVIPFEILRLRDVDVPDLVPPPFTILTSLFLHAGVVHLAFNMLFLWIFGNNVEDALGRRRYVFFYLACGTVAALVHVATSGASGDVLRRVQDLQRPMVGASGAIAGVLGAYLLLFPRARIHTLVLFIRVLPLPSRLFLGLWFAGQLLAVFLSENTGVAFFAHIGGFVAGLLLVPLVGTRPGWRARRVAF
jgi:membrane associated rhomboid family serine protease